MKIIKITTSNDNTKKYFFSVNGCSTHIEACLLNLSKYGYIICVSSQIGCSQKCKFCAAGNNGFLRNLSVKEIEEQVSLIVEDNTELKNKKFQVTYMGSGEPLCNYQNVFSSIDCLRNNFSNLCKVNISTTCPSCAKEFFEEIEWQKYKNFLHFQYSLHFTSDDQRHEFLYPQLMKIADAINNLDYISTILNDVYKINYIPFDKVNDKIENIEELVELMKTTKNAVLKLSKMCEINEAILIPSKVFDSFSKQIMSRMSNVEVFNSDGTDINAGCGQFYNESIL